MTTKRELESLLVGRELNVVRTEIGREASKTTTVGRVTVAETGEYAELWDDDGDMVIVEADDIDELLWGESVTYFRKYGETEKVIRQNQMKGK